MKLGQVAFLPTDVALVVDQGLRKYVKRMAQDQDLYVTTFGRTYQKLVDSRATTSVTLATCARRAEGVG